jgi:hypothetical protein
MHTHVTRSLVFSLSLFACSANDAASSTTPAGPARASSDVPSATGSPVSVLTSGGTYWFVFDESLGVADPVKGECARRSPDPSTAEACVDRIRKAGAQEGIRLSGSDPARLVWTSFGVTGGAEEVYVELPLAVTGVDGARVEVRPTGPARGTHAPTGDRAPQRLVFEVLDASTVAMIDPDKGRMVFRAR